MAPHGFPPIKNKPEGLSKPKTTVTYQTGVDVLGFPIYAEHHIITGTSKGNKINPVKKKWLTVVQKIIKQH